MFFCPFVKLIGYREQCKQCGVLLYLCNPNSITHCHKQSSSPQMTHAAASWGHNSHLPKKSQAYGNLPSPLPSLFSMLTFNRNASPQVRRQAQRTMMERWLLGQVWCAYSTASQHFSYSTPRRATGLLFSACQFCLPWHGSVTQPATAMLCTLPQVTYTIVLERRAQAFSQPLWSLPCTL